MTKDIECGIDRVRCHPENLNTTSAYGLVTNLASINKKGLSTVSCLTGLGYKILKLFSPEHGYQTSGQDGVFQEDSLEESKQIPILSLYGNQLKPTSGQLAGLDGMIIDLPNTGSRFYTYLWTMAQVLEVCHKTNTPVIILDRPNPLGGVPDDSEGPVLQPEFYSFIGDWSIPIRFGLTLGELALLLKKEKELTRCTISVIKVDGWSRVMNISNYHYPFVAPSPAIKEPETIFSYPVLCYLEATNISEGRGTDHPFHLVIAPWIDGIKLIHALEKFKLNGLCFEPIRITPTEHKYAGIPCEGIKLNRIDPLLYKPVKTGMILLAIIKSLYPDHFCWQPYPTLANPNGNNHFEKLTGNRSLIQWLENSPMDHMNELDQLLDCTGWAARCASILLYE